MFDRQSLTKEAQQEQVSETTPPPSPIRQNLMNTAETESQHNESLKSRTEFQVSPSYLF